MRARTADRIGALLSVLLLTALVLGSYWMVERLKRDSQNLAPRAAGHEPEADIRNVVLLRTDIEGKPRDRLTADQLIRYADDGSGELLNPVVDTLRDDRARMHARAQKAQITGDQSQIDLSGQVVFTRDATATTSAATIHTEQLRLFPDTDRAESSEAVRIERSGSTLTGIGMKLDNLAKTLEVHERARLVIAPPAQR